MNVYFGGAFERKDEIASYAEETLSLGVVPTATWLVDEKLYDRKELEASPTEAKLLAMRDLHDIMESQTIILFTGPIGRGGHQVEMGFALATGIRIVIVGPVVNLFGLLAHARYETWEAAKVGEFGVEGEKETDE